MPDDGDFSSVSPEDFIAPIGSVGLNMTDQAGSRGNLFCNVQKPRATSPISLDSHSNSTVLKASFSASLVCSIDDGHIQQLWSILALYSNTPLNLERNVLATSKPLISYRYKQIYSETDELFTNVETELRADPAWLMQSKVALQLDRTATTLHVLHIQYATDAQIVLPSADEKLVRNNWTIISRDSETRTEHTVLVGGTVELECQAAGEPAPAVAWILADGSRVRAPYISEDGRITVAQTGTFTLRTADTFDTGLYHCIGTNDNDADTLTFRITVVDPYVEHNRVNGAQLSAAVGSTLYLPCTATAIPDATVSWVLPEHMILHRSVRNKHVFDNGTLRIHRVTERDSGYFQCVAANQYGADLLVFQVLVRNDETPLTEKHVAGGVWEESDGSGNAALASATTQKHPLAALATSTAHQGSAASARRNGVTQSTRKRNSHEKITYRHYRDRISRRFRGHRRQFVSSARRVDPQRWAAFLEKTKRNSTFLQKRGEVATNPPVQVAKFSEVPEDEEETSGDLTPPEEEFMIPVTETATASAPGRSVGSVVTAGLEVTMRNAPARKTFLLAAEAVTSLPPPFSQPVSSDSRQPPTYLKPTVTTSGERSAASQTSANGLKPSAISNGESGTATLFPARQRLVYSGGSNNQHLKSVPMTDVTDASKSVTSPNAVDKLHVFTESTVEISPKTGHQVPAVTVGEPHPEFGPVYFHGTQKQVTPQPPLASTIIAHQQGQIIQDVTTHTAQAQQQYGRQRKISGRRWIVRPGHIPSTKEHRFDFGRPGSLRSGTAVAANVQMNVKYISNLPTLNNSSSSINLLSPEAPLSSPSMNLPLEHPGGTHRNTAFLREEENEHSARQKAATMVVPFITEGTHSPPQWRVESSAPSQRSTEGVQPSSTSLPRQAIRTAHTAAETTHTISTKLSSPLASVSPSVKPRTSPKNSQRGKVTWEHLSGNGAQKKVLEKLPNQTDALPSTEVSTVPPGTTAASSMSKTSPLPFSPVSTGGRHRGAVLSLTVPSPYGHRKAEEAEEHLPTANPQPHSSPATSATTEMDGASLEPTIRPIITPQVDTRSKTFRVGRKRGQRRKRPSKTPTSPSVTADHGTVPIPWVNAATVATAQSLPVPASLTPAEPLSGSAGAVSETETSALRMRNAPEASQHVPTAATWTSATPIMQTGNSQSATSPPDTPVALSPTTPTQTTPRLSKPFSPTGARPATVSATLGPEPAQQIQATTTAGEKSHPKTEERVTHENLVAQPMISVRMETRIRAPAAAGDTAPPRAQHPTPPPAPAAAVPPPRAASPTSPPWGAQPWQKPSAGVTESGSMLPASTETRLKSSQGATRRAPLWRGDKDGSLKGWSEKRRDRESTTTNPIAMDSSGRNHFTKPRITGGKLAAFTVPADSDAFIPCEATGHPRPTIQWTKIPSGK